MRSTDPPVVASELPPELPVPFCCDAPWTLAATVVVVAGGHGTVVVVDAVVVVVVEFGGADVDVDVDVEVLVVDAPVVDVVEVTARVGQIVVVDDGATVVVVLAVVVVVVGAATTVMVARSTRRAWRADVAFDATIVCSPGAVPGGTMTSTDTFPSVSATTSVSTTGLEYMTIEMRSSSPQPSPRTRSVAPG